MKNLIDTIKKLNIIGADENGKCAWFDFRIRENKKNDGSKLIEIYDSNENYNIDYLEEQNSLLYETCRELGFDYEPYENDDIHDDLLKAIKKDFGEEAYLEWENNVVMVVAI